MGAKVVGPPSLDDLADVVVPSPTDGAALVFDETSGKWIPGGTVASGPGFYRHTQGTPSDTWTINHNLGRNPSIVVVDSANEEVYAGITHPTLNQSIVTFAGAMSGSATAN